ncbi:hypothetical protein BH09PAT1_BH09PAT1_3950 [soil metagenome]
MLVSVFNKPSLISVPLNLFLVENRLKILNLISSITTFTYFGYNVLKHYQNQNMNTNIPLDKEDAAFEEGILRGILEPYFSDITDVKIGYDLMCEIITVFKSDFPQIEPKLNDYYTEITRVVESAFDKVESEIQQNYDHNSRNDLPRDFIHPHIFEGYFYRPFVSLHEAESLIQNGKLSWHNIEKSMNECRGRITNAYFRLLGKNEIISAHNSLYTDASNYIKQLPTNSTNSPILNCGELELNLKKGTIRYKDNATVSVAIEGREVKFLTLLLQHGEKILRYDTVASLLQLSFYHKGVTNEDAGEEIRYLKRDLVKLLKKVGMSKDDIDRMITVQKNVGYQLNYK